MHYVVRLTAPDGYTASRSYSVASAPDKTGEIELTIEKLDGGEVSEYLHEIVVPGDELELRGPIGGYFAWRGDTPALLVGGGSGVVPLMAMLARPAGTGAPTWCGWSSPRGHPPSSTTPASYRGPRPPSSTRARRRRTRPARVGRLVVADLTPVVQGRADARSADAPRGEDVYVCGSSGFADAATTLLLDAGVAVDQIRVERFGPSG